MGVLQVFERFFEDLAGDAAPPAPGYLYWVPVPETQEVPRVLDVQRATPDEHWATGFEITEIGNHHLIIRSIERTYAEFQAANTEPDPVPAGTGYLAVRLTAA
jgi:hypothetical protein